MSEADRARAYADEALARGLSPAEAAAFALGVVLEPRREPDPALRLLEPPGLSGEHGFLSLGAQVLRAQTMPPTEWVIPSLIPTGLTLLVGAEKIGKSFVSLDLTFAVAAGGMAMGALRCEEGDSIYIALEDHIVRLVDRLTSLEPDQSSWPLERMALVTQTEATGHLSPVLDRWYEQAERPRLVVIDTLGSYKNLLMGTGRGRDLARSSGYDADVALLRPLQAWALAHNVGMVVVHHTNQSKWEQGDNWTTKVSGTTGLTGTADQIILVRGERGAPEAEMLLVGRDMEDAVYDMHRMGPWWQITGGVR